MELSKTLYIKSSKKDFLKLFISIFKDAYRLTSKEIDVIVAILEVRSELLNKISDVSLVNKLLFSSEYRDRIAILAGIADRKSLDINYISSLKKKSVIVEKGKEKFLTPNLIIHLKDSYNLLLSFTHDRPKNT